MRCLARRLQRDAAGPGVSDQDGGVHAPFVQVVEDRLGVGGEARGLALARAVAGAVGCHRVQVGRQSGQDRLPVGGAAGLAVEQDEFVRVAAVVAGAGSAWHGSSAGSGADSAAGLRACRSSRISHPTAAISQKLISR